MGGEGPRTPGADREADREKEAVAHALDVLRALSITGAAKRAGVSVSLLRAYADPERWNRPDPAVLAPFTKHLRREAARLLAAADRLDRIPPRDT